MTDARYPDREERLDFGYRMPSGEEFWVNDYGTDGAWTSYVQGRSLSRSIDVDASTTLDDFAAAVGDEAQVLFRTVVVMRGPVQEYRK